VKYNVFKKLNKQQDKVTYLLEAKLNAGMVFLAITFT